MIAQLERYTTWIEKEGVPSDILATTLEEIVRQVNENTVLSGSGTPEANVTASPRKLYMDTSGTAGSILYIKKTGTAKTGWVLV